MSSEKEQDRIAPRALGLLGELHVEQRLIELGWHPVRLDAMRTASNADLFAVRGRQRVAIQVKTTAGYGHSHSGALGFGYATAYLRDGTTIFNSKDSPLIADVVIGVSYLGQGSRFVVMPVALAEALCRQHCDYWNSVPKRAGETRSHSFPIYLTFTATRSVHLEHHEGCRRNLAAFENAWRVLEEPVERLHDSSAWPLL